MTRRAGKAPSQRQLRVGEEIRHVLANMIERGEVRDPGLGGVSVTVTEVRISPDLRRATAFVVPLGGGDTAAVVQALGRARRFVRRRIAAEVRLRYVPDIDFRADTSFEEAGRIEALLKEPAVARDLAAEEPAETNDEDADRGA